MKKVFISYSHLDWRWRDKLEKQLSVPQMEEILSIWSDKDIFTGDDWLPEIEKAINESCIAVLLVSADFLTSDFIRKKEVPQMLGRRSSKELRVMPLLVEPCLWETVPWLKSMQMKPLKAKPLSQMVKSKSAQTLTEFAREIINLLPKSAPALAEEEEEPQPEFNIAYRKSIREGIEGILAKKGMEALCQHFQDVIRRKTKTVFPPEQLGTYLTAIANTEQFATRLTYLEVAFEECLPKEKSERRQQLWENVMDLIGWTVLLSVKSDWLEKNHIQQEGEAETATIKLSFPKMSEVGLEVAHSAIYPIKAKFHRRTGTEGARVCQGQRMFRVEGAVDLGPAPNDSLTKLKKVLWKELFVRESDPPDIFDKVSNDALKTRLYANGLKKDFCYLPIDLDEGNKKDNEALIERIRGEFPSLRLIEMKSDEGDALLFLEGAIQDRVSAFIGLNPKES